MQPTRSRKNKLMLISLFEKALICGAACLQAKNNRVVVIHESYLDRYPRLINMIKEKIIRQIPIKKEDCFLLLYAHRDKITSIKPGFLFYSNGSIYLEENWMEENCYWEDSIFDILHTIIQYHDVKVVDALHYID